MPGQRRPELNVTGLVAGAAATVSSTVAASYFGVGGTLIGAGVVSVLSTVGATYYQHFLDRGKAQLAAKMPVRVSAGGDTAGGDAGVPDETSPARTGGRAGGRAWPKWYVLAGAAGGVFLAVMGLVTAFELVTGKPLANTVQGKAGHGTSVDPGRTAVHPGPLPTPAGGVTPAGTPTPSASPATVPTERTAQTTPTAAASAPSPPVRRPGQRPSASEAPLGPAATRSPVPQQPPAPGDGDLRPTGF